MKSGRPTPESQTYGRNHRSPQHIHLRLNTTPAPQNYSNPVSHELPSKDLVKEALAGALKSGYSKNVVSQILEYRVDLNIAILDYEQIPDTETIPLYPDTIPVTPLEWAVEHDRVDLVSLFLGMDADANFTLREVQGPSLIRAVRRRNLQLVDILVQRTGRVSSTRALGLAVDQEDTAGVDILLANGVSCDFEESDRPRPPDPVCFDLCTFGEPPKLLAEDFTPPLVQASRLGNTGLVRLLLAHGADADARISVSLNPSGQFRVTHVRWYQEPCISR